MKQERMVTEVHVAFKGLGYGVLHMRGWDEPLYETRERAVCLVQANYGKVVKVEIIYQAEDFYDESGTHLRRISY